MRNSKHQGQGVIEYTGALIIATVLVVAVMTTGVDGLTNLFINIVDSIQHLLMGKVNSL